MGRAIDHDKKLDDHERRLILVDDHERRLKLVEDALEELVATKVKHVDLSNLDKHEKRIREENSDEEFTPPAGKRKRSTKKSKAVATT